MNRRGFLAGLFGGPVATGALAATPERYADNGIVRPSTFADLDQWLLNRFDVAVIPNEEVSFEQGQSRFLTLLASGPCAASAEHRASSAVASIALALETESRNRFEWLQRGRPTVTRSMQFARRADDSEGYRYWTASARFRVADGAPLTPNRALYLAEMGIVNVTTAAA